MDPLRRMTRCVWALLLSLCLLAPGLSAQEQDWVRKNYIKTEINIPMRDGKKLFTAIYRPKKGKDHPILMLRTPYGVAPYGSRAYPPWLGPAPGYAEEGFIFVYQDVRGRNLSEGTFVDMTPHRKVKTGPGDIDESTDTYDTIAWLLAHVPGHNGKVGQWGISYPGFYTAAGMIDAHPALVASSPQAPIVDWFDGDDFHRNGALWLPHLFNFISWFGLPRPKPVHQRQVTFGHGTPDGYAFFLELGPLANANARYFKGRIPFWNQVMAHSSRDAFWKARDLRPHLHDIRPAVLVVGGWFDAENLFGTLQTYKTLRAQSPGTNTMLVMGPWYHGGWVNSTGESLGQATFGSATSDYFQNELQFPFFCHYLKGGPPPKAAQAVVFQTGANRWVHMAAWPPQTQPLRYFLQTGRKLTTQPPTVPTGTDAFLSDPARPVPSFEGLHVDMPIEYMVADQRFVASRADVLTFRSEPLDKPLTVAGPIRVHLNVSTTGTDADWVVKVIDEYPGDGYQQLVRGEVMRGKFRNSLENPEPFVPGQPTAVAWPLNDIFHTFRQGHRVTVQIQSSWFPLMDRNPQVFTDIYAARAEDFKPALHRVHRSQNHPSYLDLPILEP